MLAVQLDADDRRNAAKDLQANNPVKEWLILAGIDQIPGLAQVVKDRVGTNLAKLERLSEADVDAMLAPLSLRSVPMRKAKSALQSLRAIPSDPVEAEAECSVGATPLEEEIISVAVTAAKSSKRSKKKMKAASPTVTHMLPVNAIVHVDASPHANQDLQLPEEYRQQAHLQWSVSMSDIDNAHCLVHERLVLPLLKEYYTIEASAATRAPIDHVLLYVNGSEVHYDDSTSLQRVFGAVVAAAEGSPPGVVPKTTPIRAIQTTPSSTRKARAVEGARPPARTTTPAEVEVRLQLVPPTDWVAALARSRERVSVRVEIEAGGVAALTGGTISTAGDAPAYGGSRFSYKTELVGPKVLSKPLETALVEPALKELSSLAVEPLCIRPQEVIIHVDGVGTVDGRQPARYLMSDEVGEAARASGADDDDVVRVVLLMPYCTRIRV